MAFHLFCMGLIGLLFGLAVTFGRYRLFLILLPVWGFFFGLVLGAERPRRAGRRAGRRTARRTSRRRR